MVTFGLLPLPQFQTVCVFLKHIVENYKVSLSFVLL